MSGQRDLFAGTGAAPYPERPGAQRRDTSAAAAEAIADAAPTLRALVLGYLRQHGPQTADEIAAKAGLGILSVRPRVSELVKLGRVIATAERRPNASGHSAIVWRAGR